MPKIPYHQKSLSAIPCHYATKEDTSAHPKADCASYLPSPFLCRGGGEMGTVSLSNTGSGDSSKLDPSKLDSSKLDASKLEVGGAEQGGSSTMAVQPPPYCSAPSGPLTFDRQEALHANGYEPSPTSMGIGASEIPQVPEAAETPSGVEATDLQQASAPQGVVLSGLICLQKFQQAVTRMGKNQLASFGPRPPAIF